MKKIISLILAILMLFALTACNGSSEPTDAPTEPTAAPTDEPTEEPEATEPPYEKLYTHCGKTPKELYTYAKALLADVTSFYIYQTNKTTIVFNGENITSYGYMEYKTDGNAANFKLLDESGNTSKEVHFADNVMYTTAAQNKEKNSISNEDFFKNYNVGIESIIFEFDDTYFNDSWLFLKDGVYNLNIYMSSEQYKAISGMDADTACLTLGFDADAKLISCTQMVEYSTPGGYLVKEELITDLRSLGTVDPITLPADAQDYRTPPAMDSLDMSAVDINKVEISDTATDLVLIDVKDFGKIVLRLYFDVAPTTVANFKELVAAGFYDGLTFHRIIENFMIQGGEPKGDETGGSENSIVGEFAQNGFTNNLSHIRGVVSMARASDPDSASSQFFIVHKDSTDLDSQYAAFGYVVSGMDVVDAIAAVETNSSDKPLSAVTIQSIKFARVTE